MTNKQSIFQTPQEYANLFLPIYAKKVNWTTNNYSLNEIILTLTNMRKRMMLYMMVPYDQK